MFKCLFSIQIHIGVSTVLRIAETTDVEIQSCVVLILMLKARIDLSCYLIIKNAILKAFKII